MNPGIADHIYAILILGAVFPLGGLWAYRRFLARVERDGGGALVREYKITLLWQAGLIAGALAAWSIGGRNLLSLFITMRRIAVDDDIVPPIAIGLAMGLFVRPLLAAASARIAAGLRKQFEPLAPFLPKDNRQLAWGLIVSVGAGLSEEIAYRGFLQPYFATWLPVWGAIAAASLLFGFAHFYQGKAGTIMTGVLGVALGVLYWITGSLLLPILLHAGIDISSMISARIVLARKPEPQA